jgi:hypothetical protein
LQRTALRARKIVAFLKGGFSPTALLISNAPPLKRNTLGGVHSRTIILTTPLATAIHTHKGWYNRAAIHFDLDHRCPA